jgi:beta-1,4-mannosyltransferase
MKKAYIYPVTAYASKTIPNPYLENFMNSLEPDFYFVNRKKPSDKGILDLFTYFQQIDCVFLNWIEDLPDKKGGWLQGMFLIVMIFILKLKNIKIIWTLHNKLSHYKSNYLFKKFLFRFILHKSDYVITHSREGVQYVRQYNLKNMEKIKYFPHPLEKKFVSFNSNPSNDILIWGSLIPYKGIDKFLLFLHENNIQFKYKIKLIGKVKPDGYKEVIARLCNENIVLDDRYISEDELKNAVIDSKIVLFTYMGNSVLSSGVLMDTLSYGGRVLAPCVGAFKDAEEDRLIKTFTNFEELILRIDEVLLQKPDNLNTLTMFIEENNWQKFSQKIIKWIS